MNFKLFVHKIHVLIFKNIIILVLGHINCTQDSQLGLFQEKRPLFSIGLNFDYKLAI